LSGTPAPGCGTGATSRDVDRGGTTPPSSGNGLVWPPSLTRRPTGTPAHRRHATDRMLAWLGGLRLRLGRRSIHPDRAWVAGAVADGYQPSWVRAGSAGSRAARPRGGRSPARPSGPARRWDGRGRRELQWPAWLVGQAHLGAGVAVVSASTVSLSLQGMGGSLLVGRRWPREVREWASRLRRPGLAVVERGRQVVIDGGGPAAVGDGLRGRLRLLTRGWGGHGRFGRRGSRCGPGRAL
jgi:hypothetical protein